MDVTGREDLHYPELTVRYRAARMGKHRASAFEEILEATEEYG